MEDSSLVDSSAESDQQENGLSSAEDSSSGRNQKELTDISATRGIVRERNRYLVYPDSYEMELKGFPKDITEEQKNLLMKALGDYAYEEGFVVKTAEYVSELSSNATDAVKLFGICLNEMDDFYVVALWDSTAIHGTSDLGRWLIIMDDGSLNKATAFTLRVREYAVRN